MENFETQIVDYICSGHAMLSVVTHEKDRAIEHINRVAKEINRNVYYWSIAAGWRNDQNPTLEAGPLHPVACLRHAIGESGFPENSIFILKDFGVYVDRDTSSEFDVVISLLDEIRPILSHQGQTVIFIGPDFKIPNILRHDITEIDFKLPDKESILEGIKFVCDGVERNDGSKFEPNEDLISDIVDACQGMTQQEILDRVALAIRKHKDFTPEAVRTVIHEKGNTIKSSGLLEFIEPLIGGLDLVGGYNVLKKHVQLDKPCFNDKAREFGIGFPRGLLMVGIPGCGKTLLSIAIASEFGFPLLSLDVGNCMGSLVGESEKNIREAIKICESIAPCVLQVDEVEKAFGGNNSLDGGSSKRVFGMFLKWLSSRISPVYVVATANEVQSLPQEFCRTGRFDAIFSLDLPHTPERKQIFNIHLSKRNKDTDLFDLEELAQKTKGFTGSDIEESVRLGLKIAFSCEQELKQSHLELGIDGIVPLIKTAPEKIREIQNWGEKHAKRANPKTDVGQNKQRKVTV